ncbi:MAG: hypothetical protein WDM81_13525 [Rhizomicrobium sp.]
MQPRFDIADLLLSAKRSGSELRQRLFRAQQRGARLVYLPHREIAARRQDLEALEIDTGDPHLGLLKADLPTKLGELVFEVFTLRREIGPLSEQLGAHGNGLRRPRAASDASAAPVAAPASSPPISVVDRLSRAIGWPGAHDVVLADQQALDGAALARRDADDAALRYQPADHGLLPRIGGSRQEDDDGDHNPDRKQGVDSQCDRRRQQHVAGQAPGRVIDGFASEEVRHF